MSRRKQNWSYGDRTYLVDIQLSHYLILCTFNYNGKLFGLRANEHRLLRIRFRLAPFQVKVQVVLWKMLRAMEHSIIVPLTLL